MEMVNAFLPEDQDLDGSTRASKQSLGRLIDGVGNLPIDQYTRSHAKAFLQSDLMRSFLNIVRRRLCEFLYFYFPFSQVRWLWQMGGTSF